MSTAAHRYAQAMAVTERARGRAEEERAWLDLLALLDAPAPAPSATRDEVARALEGEFGCFLARDPQDRDRFWGGAAYALLARFTITPKEDRRTPRPAARRWPARLPTTAPATPTATRHTAADVWSSGRPTSE